MDHSGVTKRLRDKLRYVGKVFISMHDPNLCEKRKKLSILWSQFFVRDTLYAAISQKRPFCIEAFRTPENHNSKLSCPF